ncbi:TlpA disulfide reductase family protein [Tamlana sp. I1]|uniref:TlpA disulfide reductase family protein n=1 Tax=Tamlana sp. I1 TaxID=2762061 RepID=UPI00188F9E05|nr:TlpA disulfide reductase family protein [Tamlana sp. I1]
MTYKGSILVLLAFLMLNCKKPSEKIEDTPKTFTLNAHIENLEADFLVYSEKDANQPNGYRIDTLWVKDQKFTFTDSIDAYTLYYITIPEAQRRHKVNVGGKEYTVSVKANLSRMWFIGYPGAEITYTGKIDGYMVDAYPSDKEGINDDLALINKQVFPLQNQINSITFSTRTDELSDEKRKEMNATKLELSEKIIDLKIDFIKSHPKSIAASYVFNDCYYRHYFSFEDAKKMFKDLDSTTLAGTTFYNESKQRLEAVEKTGIGMQAPEIKTTHTLDGSEFNLSDLKGNYVLLDYWGLWCGPCMAEIPKIKEYANKYADNNFVVVGINSGDTAQRWKKVIADYDYNWTHVQTTKDNNLLIPFNVNSFPTKILMDPEGKIIYSSQNPEKVDLYQMIDDIFSKS